jgi:hypothetical protein
LSKDHTDEKPKYSPVTNFKQFIENIGNNQMIKTVSKNENMY